MSSSLKVIKLTIIGSISSFWSFAPIKLVIKLIKPYLAFLARALVIGPPKPWIASLRSCWVISSSDTIGWINDIRWKDFWTMVCHSIIWLWRNGELHIMMILVDWRIRCIMWWIILKNTTKQKRQIELLQSCLEKCVWLVGSFR
jgi:hypothetical protein